MVKTLKQLGILFDPKSGCALCDQQYCYNSVEALESGEEYNLLLIKGPDGYSLNASISSNVDGTGNFERDFDKEEELVEFLCSTFHQFKCA